MILRLVRLFPHVAKTITYRFRDYERHVFSKLDFKDRRIKRKEKHKGKANVIHLSYLKIRYNLPYNEYVDKPRCIFMCSLENSKDSESVCETEIKIPG